MIATADGRYLAPEDRKATPTVPRARCTASALRVPEAVLSALEAVRWSRERGVKRLIVPFAPVGFEADRLAATRARAETAG